MRFRILTASMAIWGFSAAAGAEQASSTASAGASAGQPASAEANGASSAGSPSAQVGEATEEQGSLRLHLTGAAARALLNYQSEELGWGGGVVAAAEWGPVSPRWGLQLEGGWLGLSEGDQGPPPGVAALEGAQGFQAGIGARVRPFAPASRVASAAGLWLSAAGGVSFTGGSAYPQLDAFIGYDFWITRAAALGPTIGYVHVFDTDSSGPREGDGSFGLLGVHATFDFVQRRTRASTGPSDRDRDGIQDGSDRCPDQPEDVDDYEDQDGCPEPDNDADKILDSKDRCRNEPEDRDGFEDIDGCPDPDNDRDGIVDGDDECPNELEDRDGYQDADGCPELDNDDDKIVDARDLCPNEPETINGLSDGDGCPDEEHVRVVGDKIELDQKIHFWSDSSVIRALSYPVLNKLAEFIKQHPEYVHIDIEGHADERGPEALNLRLSAARASAVRGYLVKKGIDADRLSSQGFGSTRPLQEGKSEHAWFMNRRVEFIVTRETKEPIKAGASP